MFRDLQYLTPVQRRLVFVLIFGGGIMLILLVTVLLVRQALTSGERQLSSALDPNLTVREFAQLPDNDAYPSSVAVAPSGTVYTGSFGSGAVWAIDREGNIVEIPGTRDAIGAVIGLAVAPDGALLVVDQIDTDPRSAGGSVVRVDTATGEIDNFFGIIEDERGFIAPNDVALDSEGRIYVTDPGRNEVWRFDPNGENAEVWWVPNQLQGQRQAITGLAYDPLNDAMIITDPERNEIYRVGIDDSVNEILYQHGARENPPGFDGVTVTEDGTIYVAALGQNGIAILNDRDLDYIAGFFRGASDVDYDPALNRLYVPNFDQSALVLPLVQPQLPFAIDVIERTTPAEQTS